MPDSAEMPGRHLLLIGSAVTLTCTALHVDRALAHSGTILHTGTVTTPHSRVGLLRGALSESGNKEKYALVNITGRTEEASRPTPHKKKVEPSFNSLHSVGPGLPVSKILKNKPHLFVFGNKPNRHARFRVSALTSVNCPGSPRRTSETRFLFNKIPLPRLATEQRGKSTKKDEWVALIFFVFGGL